MDDNNPEILELPESKSDTSNNQQQQQRREYKKRTLSGDKQIEQTAKTLTRYFKMFAEKLENPDVELSEIESLNLADSYLTLIDKFNLDSESKFIAVIGFGVNVLNIVVSRLDVIKKWKSKNQTNQ